MSDLERVVQGFAQNLATKFAEDMTQDPREFKRRVVHSLKSALPPHRGRPPEGSVTRAGELRELGASWKEVYAACIPDYPHLDPLARRWAEYNLRSAVRSRRNSRLRRQPGEPQHAHSVKNAQPNFVE